MASAESALLGGVGALLRDKDPKPEAPVGLGIPRILHAKRDGVRRYGAV